MIDIKNRHFDEISNAGSIVNLQKGWLSSLIPIFPVLAPSRRDVAQHRSRVVLTLSRGMCTASTRDGNTGSACARKRTPPRAKSISVSSREYNAGLTGGRGRGKKGTRGLPLKVFGLGRPTLTFPRTRHLVDSAVSIIEDPTKSEVRFS